MVDEVVGLAGFAMSLLDELGSVSPGQVALVVFLVLAVWGFVWGVVRQLAGMLVLAVGCGVGWLVFVRGGQLAWMREFDDRYLFWISVIAGVTVFCFLRVVVHWIFGLGGLLAFVSGIFGKSRGKGPVGALISLLPAAFLLLVVFSVFRLAGVFEGLDETRAAVFAPAGSPPPEPSLLRRVSGWMVEVPWRDWLERHDPLDLHAMEKLGKLLLVSYDGSARRVLERDPSCRELLADPRVHTLVREIAARGMYPDDGKLLPVSREEMRDIIGDPSVRALLGQMDVDGLVQQALYEQSGNEARAVRRSFRASYR